MAETPEQYRERMQRIRLPRPQVTDLPTEDVTPGARRINRGESGLRDPIADSQSRIRGNVDMRAAPTTPNPDLERMGLGEQSKNALKRAERFTAAPGTLTANPLQGQMRPRAVGGVLAAGLGASTTALNAANVYDKTDGDWGETAKQVAYDVPGALGSTLGAVAGGALGRRSPAAATAGMLAGGSLGQGGGDEMAAGVDRLFGGDGMSPLQAIQAGEPQQPSVITTWVSSDGEYPVEPGSPGAVEVDARTGLPVGQKRDPIEPIAGLGAGLQSTANAQIAAGAAPALGGAGGGAPEIAPPVIPTTPSIPGSPPMTPPVAATPVATPAPKEAGNGYQQTGTAGIAGRVGPDGVPEFTNDPDLVAGATGSMGGTLGDGRGTFSVGEKGDAARAMASYERANEIRREGAQQDALGTMQLRQAREQQRAQQSMNRNSGRIQDLLATGKPSDKMRARALMQENASLGEQLAGARQSEQQLGLGQLDAQVQRERTEAGANGVRQQLALERQRLAQTGAQVNSRDDIAGKNAENYATRVENIFGEANEDGKTAVPPERMALIEERAPIYAQQREAALQESMAALQQRARAGDPAAAEQLQAVEADYARFRQDVYRVGSDGKTVELRPVREWSEDNQNTYFTDVKDQERRQAPRTDSAVPEAAGGLAGAAAGFAAGSRVPGGPRARLVGAAVGGALGAFAGGQAEKQALGQRSAAPQGPGNASATIAANYDRTYTDGDSVIATLDDGSVVNLDDLLSANADPGIQAGPGETVPTYGRGARSSELNEVSRTAFEAALAQARSGDPQRVAEAENVLAAYARRDDLYQTLTPAQRKRLPRREGLGE